MTHRTPELLTDSVLGRVGGNSKSIHLICGTVVEVLQPIGNGVSWGNCGTVVNVLQPIGNGVIWGIVVICIIQRGSDSDEAKTKLW